MVHTAAVVERFAFVKQVRESRNQPSYRCSNAPQMNESDRIVSHAEIRAGSHILDLVMTTIWYPVALLACWTPNFLQYVMYIYVHSSKYKSKLEYPKLHVVLNVLGVVTYALGMCYSMFAMFIFFGVKPEARVLWYRAWRTLCIRLGMVTPSDVEKHTLGLPIVGEGSRSGAGQGGGGTGTGREERGRKRPSGTPLSRSNSATRIGFNTSTICEYEHDKRRESGQSVASGSESDRDNMSQYSVSSSLYSRESGRGGYIDDEYTEEEEEEEEGGGTGEEEYVYEDETYERASILVQNIARRRESINMEQEQEPEQGQGQQGAPGSCNRSSADATYTDPTHTPTGIQLVNLTTQLDKSSPAPAPSPAISPTVAADKGAGSTASVLNALHAEEGSGGGAC